MGLELDRFGNPYVLVNRRAALGSGLNSVVYKYDKNNISGSLPWFHSLISTGPGSSNLAMTDIFVDFGDNIYFVGGDNGGTGFNRARFGRISQLYTAVPMIAKNTPNLQIQDQSLWGEFVGAVSAEASFFQIDHADTQFDIDLSETFDTFLFGEFGGSFNLDGSMAMGMGFEATASGGVVDINYPGDLDIAVPGSAKLAPDLPFTITAQFDPLSSGNIVADATPELSAGLKANVGININSSASLIAFSTEVFSTQLVNANVGWQGLIPGLSMSLPTGNPGSWQDFGDERNIVSGRLTRPLFTSNGAIDLSTGMIQSNLEPEVFFSLRGNMTNYISTYQFGTPTIYGFGEGDSSDWSFGASINIAQAFAQIELEANQSLTFEPTVSVIFEFSPPVTIHHPGGGTTPNVVSREVQMTQSASGSTWTADLDVSVTESRLSSSNSTVSIRPRSKIGGTLHNRTWVDIKPLVGWETLAAEAHADAGGQNLFGFDFCELCYEVPLSADIPIDLFDTTLNLPETIVELDPIVIAFDPDNDGIPRVSGTSRARLTSFIYDQIDANPFELAGFINQPSKKMLVYGDWFSVGGAPQISGIVMCSQGREELLPTTILNSRTALVEIPNKMRLVPGIARIWAVDFGGEIVSDSIDFPIELPVPNLGTAGPNLWAADPRLSNIAIDVIDGLTPAGTPSFIARRDYWFVLADMWDAIDVGSGQGLFDSFPNYDFTAEPPMPSVLINITESPILTSTRHHWSFDGDFQDSVGTADGTPGGTTPEFVSAGVPLFVGQAADFSGGKMTVDRSSLTNMGTSNYSFAFWMKLSDSTASTRRIFSSNASGSINGLSIGIQNGVGSVYVGAPDGFSGTNFQNGLTFPSDSRWHHYAVIIRRNGASGVYWYQDGELGTFQGAGGKFGFLSTTHTDPVKIGMGGGNNNDIDPLNGQLGDMNIFNRAITLEEIQSLASPVERIPIGRFRQPVENGILYSLLPKSEYDEPKLVSISLDVAGPGGGKSNSINLTVAAPSPVVSNVIPRQIVPDAGQFTMTVEGPLSVPFFNGFQEERFGNFN
ncbi:MAG: LamG domain-containing protein, partial [Phycisphaerales bacterium]|nr:LamG domain-containing protein [Phycisphaerales bacterium]